jgi:anti-sigma regulatory factor (Ser/Thr protein kinase)
VLDYGPGIADLPAAVEDGYTTVRTMGKGLGAVRRLAHESEFYTIPEGVAPDMPWHGMSAWVRFYLDAPKKKPKYEFGRYLRAYQDNVHNGDFISLKVHDSTMQWLHMDGLGHGKSAYDVIKDADTFMNDNQTPLCTMEKLSSGLKGTRGAVAMVAELDIESQSGTICGVGDMAAYTVCDGRKRAISFAPGVLGHEHRRFEETRFDFPQRALFITASDGIRKSWDLQTFPGLWRLHPQLIALFLGNAAGRGNDDKSLFVIRTTPPRGN